MHIFFSGIGGGGIGALASMAQQAGYDVSGSDKQTSSYTEAIEKLGIPVHIGQSKEAIAAVHAKKPIDWLVYSSAVPRENPNHPELVFAKEHDIKLSKRDELLNKLLSDFNFKLIAIAGTHGKTTTTAMMVWLLKQIDVPFSYNMPAKISFGPSAHLDPRGEYFVYECDEFDRNFLAFHPYLSLITGITWDHHEIFPTQADYYQAFRDFMSQSAHTIVWRDEAARLELSDKKFTVIDEDDPAMVAITLPGKVNRQDAWQVVQAVRRMTDKPVEELIEHINRFPGVKQRMEELAPNLYTNYAHTPEKISGGLGVALEIARERNQEVVIIYEPLTNRRQHFMQNDFKDCFAGAKKVYWLPTYLAREDPNLPILTPAELIAKLDDPSIAEPAERDDVLLDTIRTHLKAGDMVVAMAPSGGGSLDEWLREHIKEITHA